MKKSRDRCPDADAYNPTSPPLCSTMTFLTCDSCRERWQEAQTRRVKRANDPKFIERHGLKKRIVI